MGTDQYCFDAWEVVLNVPSHFQAIRVGHIHVCDHQVRHQGSDQVNGFRAGAGLAHHLEVFAALQK